MKELDAVEILLVEEVEQLGLYWALLNQNPR